MDVSATDPGLRGITGGGQDRAVRTPYVHQVTLVMNPEADLDAPGAAVILGLCGSWDHTPPCSLAYHVHAERTGTTVILRVIFATETDNEENVRLRIDQALRAGTVTDRAGKPTYWDFAGSCAAELNSSEAARAWRLAGA